MSNLNLKRDIYLTINSKWVGTSVDEWLCSAFCKCNTVHRDYFQIQNTVIANSYNKLTSNKFSILITNNYKLLIQYCTIKMLNRSACQPVILLTPGQLF